MGNPKYEFQTSIKLETDGLIPIYKKEYGRVIGLPYPDLNKEKYYIVNEDIIEAVGKTRSDLVVPSEPFLYQGATYYKTLILPS